MSVLTIATPAATRSLLTQAQLRAAAGLAIADTSRDTELAAIGLTVADVISDYCNVVGDGIAPATLRQETLVETFRLTAGTDPLILSRRFLGTVAVVADDIALNATDFLTDAAAGTLTRLYSDRPTCWAARKIVVTYEAGFAEVPTPLADVATEMVQRRTGTARDPLTRRERIKTDGVEEIDREFWVSEANDADVTPDMAAKLDRYKTIARG